MSYLCHLSCLCWFVHSDVELIFSFCVLFVFIPLVFIPLCYQFLWIVHL